jgi:hypothetical protein
MPCVRATGSRSWVIGSTTTPRGPRRRRDHHPQPRPARRRAAPPSAARRGALQSGRLRIRAAETILPVARGDAEPRWVQRAAEVTVRQLEQEVRRARKGLPEPDKDWLRLRTQLRPEDREVFELGLEVAAHVLPSVRAAPPRAPEGRAALPRSGGTRQIRSGGGARIPERIEKRLWESPALGEAKRQKVSYEKLRVLALLTKDGDIGAWTPRAHALTCIELRRRVTGEKQRQMRAARKLAMPVPRRLAVLLAAAAQAVRDLAGCVVPLGRCLAIIAAHFIGVWNDHVKAPRTWSQKVRARDKGLCVVPGCSHPAPDGHHVEFRSRGGSNDGANGMGSCRFHHHRCIHAGYMHVEGSAPDDLRFFVGGKPFTGGTGRDPTGG